jgi:hypothetical protein
LALILSFQHKHRIDQIVGRDLVFTHQVAGEVVTAQAAWAAGGKWGDGVHVENCASSLAWTPSRAVPDRPWRPRLSIGKNNINTEISLVNDFVI